MRCYFTRDGHIAAVEILVARTDADAVAQAHKLFHEREEQFSGFEVWDRARFIYRYRKDGESS